MSQMAFLSFSLDLFAVFLLYALASSSMLQFNPCRTKDPRAGAAGAGVTDAVEQPPQTDAEPEGKMNDKGADEAQREDEQPRENRGDEEVKSEEKEEEKKDEAAGRSY